jgi:hypothetical protein
MRRPPLTKRNRRLVDAILATLYPDDDEEPTPFPWNELVDAFSGQYEPKTIDNTLRDLVAFGAAHKVGTIGRNGDTRALLPTPLGRAWLDRVTLHLPIDFIDTDNESETS